MKLNSAKLIRSLFLGIGVLAVSTAILTAQVPNRLSFNGQQVWVKGVNLPWYNYGDFGNHYQWGNMYNSGEMETRLSAIAAKSFNTVRIWVYADGRTSPEWSAGGAGGSPTGHDSQFFTNMDDFLARCNSKGLYVILSLFDHYMLNGVTGAGQYAGHHEQVITDSAKRAAWMNNVLGPLVSRYAQNTRILSWEVFNEPEWNCSDLPGGGTTVYKVTTSQMQQFIAEMNVKVHSYNPKGLVSIGSSALKWSSPNTDGGNPWSDSALMAKVGNDTRAKLDFINVHYYDWMNPWFTPWSQTPAQWGLTKPCIVSESQGNSSLFNAVAQRDGLASKGHAGICFWSYWGGDGYGAWSDFQNVFVGWTPPGGTAPTPVTIYGDALASDWSNWSWSSTVSFNETAIKKNGTASTKVTANAGWSALSLRKGTALSTSGFSKITFWVHGGTGSNKSIKVFVSTADSGGDLAGKVITATANTWTLITANFSEIGNPASIKRLTLQNNSGTSQPAVYFDDIRME
jgi:hypothetical protein